MNHYDKGVITYAGWPDKTAGHIQVITVVEVSPCILFRKASSRMQNESMRRKLKGAPQGAKPARGGIRQMGRAKDVTGFYKDGEGGLGCAGRVDQAAGA